MFFEREILIFSDATRPITYQELDAHQRQVQARVEEGGAGALLLAEVAPVITIGRRTDPGDLLLSADALSVRGIEVLRTDRGGLATYHGPGQWILFPVDRLEALTGDRRGVRKAVEALLEIACDVVRTFDPQARIEWDARTGVWGANGKYASVGIHVERGVLLHGLALNVYRTAQSFVGLRPCGLDVAPSFLAETECGRERCWAQASPRAFFDQVGKDLLRVANERLDRRPSGIPVSERVVDCSNLLR